MNDLKIISDKLKIFCNHFSKLNGFFENVLNPVLTYGDKVYEFLSKHGEDPKILNDHNALVGSLKNVQKNILLFEELTNKFYQNKQALCNNYLFFEDNYKEKLYERFLNMEYDLMDLKESKSEENEEKSIDFPGMEDNFFQTNPEIALDQKSKENYIFKDIINLPQDRTCQNFNFFDVKIENFPKKRLKKGKSIQRGPYNCYSAFLKKNAITKANEKGVRFSSNEYNIPINTLKRWMKVGIERKKGGGRKVLDSEMEMKLNAWCCGENFKLTKKIIKKKALQFSNFKSDFKASRGWLKNFIRRFHLENSININN